MDHDGALGCWLPAGATSPAHQADGRSYSASEAHPNDALQLTGAQSILVERAVDVATSRGFPRAALTARS
jgi:hypothetical protein